MKTMNLRDANQQFSKLVREVEDSGQTVVVLRNGRPVVKISAMVPKPLPRTPEQDAALARLLDPKNHFRSPQDGRSTNRKFGTNRSIVTPSCVRFPTSLV
jgi:prevent-host-death family protein